MERVTTMPGDGALLHRGQAMGFRLHEDTWLLEYGRGPVPTALPMALGDAVFSGMDPRTIVKTLGIYGKMVVGQLARGKI
jgi:C-8 sterol isomerase